MKLCEILHQSQTKSGGTIFESLGIPLGFQIKLEVNKRCKGVPK